jgi:formate/nitrite transporter FocA (FNT family)
MDRHVDILAILTTVWGALAMLVGVSALLLAVGPVAILSEPVEGVGFAAGFVAVVFAGTGLFALVWGAVHVWAATLIRRRQPLGRLVGLGLAVINLIILPFGTAFGIYALWVLLTNEGRRLFEYNHEEAGRR